MYVTPFPCLQHLEMASCQIMLSSTFLIIKGRAVAYELQFNRPSLPRADVRAQRSYRHAAPLIFRAPSPKKAVHYDRLSDVETLVVAVGCISRSACNDRSTTHRLAGTIA